jgi:hypothetical protein
MENQQKPGETLMGAVVVVIVLLVVPALGRMVLAAVCFLALLWTLVCLTALTGTRRLGECVVTPRLARAALACGALGGVLVPAFALFCDTFADVRIPASWYPYLAALGYAAGNLTLIDRVAEADPRLEVLPPGHTALPAPDSARIEPTFRFAAWSDEEPRP